MSTRTRSRTSQVARILCLLSIFAFTLEISSAFNLFPSKRDDTLQLGESLGNLFQAGTATDDEHTCTKDKPCSNEACCGPDGFCGFGPKYCEDGCQSNCDAHAECGEFSPGGNETCPLNVCCSEFGFCGTTEKFCGGNCQSNCGQPSLPPGRSSRPVREKVIAYYEAWEYPGATDRGGKRDDMDNFVQLIKTLKKTFDKSPRGGYGLTFTIPSSYWYLRWFDVPRMLDAGADWVNLMSYDLHGVWDQHNPIGSYVHGHTNLTEIKESASLLWRNHVPPGKVVLGTGFNGCSFQLRDTSCSEPGCAFTGAAEKGQCADEGGILGYFEIQEIAKRDDVEKIHDKEAAVNYFTFNDDQWVSYDDAETFQQKVKWADSVGLGGLMAWAIDLEDKNFTALGGLIGRDPGTGLDKTLTKRALEAEKWSSDTGQDCYTTDCGEECKLEEVGLTSYPSNCKNHKFKKVCCPRDRAPRTCQWRGGETGGPGRACHGQCHKGELTLFYDGYGTRHCATGKQAFCCTADRDDIQLALSSYGQSSSLCGTAGRKKSLCCAPPEDVELFTPVPLEYLFPDPPPVTDPVKWDLQILGGYGPEGGMTTSQNPTSDPALGAFRFVLISGPKDVVSSFSKRDGSHIEVLDCASIISSDRQTTRVVCTYDGPDSNCDDILENGLEGTIVRMSDECGPGSYVVAHSLTESVNQTLPHNLMKRMSGNNPVMEMEFSYDFTRMKRADEPVHLRIDYSNMPGYWDSLVDEPGEESESSQNVRARGLSQRDLMDKRFFSEDSARWGSEFDDLSETDYYTDLSMPAKETIISEKLECDEESSYLEIKSDGMCSIQTRFGFTIIGTLQPFDVDQAFGFADVKYELVATVNVTGNIGVDTEFKTRPAHISPKTDIGFSHPGIVSFEPSFDIQIGIKGNNASFSGKFMAHLHTQTDPSINHGFIRVTLPYGAGGVRGGSKAYRHPHPFEGHMVTNNGDVEVTLNPKFAMDINFNQQSTIAIAKRERNDVQPRQSGDSLVSYLLNIYAPNKVAWNTDGVDLLIDASYYSFTNHGDGIIQPWEGVSGISRRSYGSQPGAISLHTQESSESDAVPIYKEPLKLWTMLMLTFSLALLTKTRKSSNVGQIYVKLGWSIAISTNTRTSVADQETNKDSSSSLLIIGDTGISISNVIH